MDCKYVEWILKIFSSSSYYLSMCLSFRSCQVYLAIWLFYFIFFYSNFLQYWPNLSVCDVDTLNIVFFLMPQLFNRKCQMFESYCCISCIMMMSMIRVWYSNKSVGYCCIQQDNWFFWILFRQCLEELIFSSWF